MREATVKNILVLMHDDRGQEARLQAALDITRAVGGHLTCLDVTTNPLLVAGYAGTYSGAVLALDEPRTETLNRDRIQSRLKVEDVPYSWVDVDGDPATCLRREATLADLIVINRGLDDEAAYPNMFDIAGDLIMEGRTPIMAVPEKAKSLDVRRPAIVAWDGSDHAAAAMRAAVPLLKLAESVMLFYARDGSLKVPLEEAAAYLSRHGVHASVRSECCLLDSPQALIMSEAVVAHAGYVVMGAFSRSRFREAVFGGATQRMLTESPVPLFIARQP